MAQQPDFDWFEVRSFAHDIYGIGEPGHFEDVKSFLVVGDELAMLVDTGMGIADIRAVAESLTDRPILVVNSHGHLDHIGDNWRFDRIWAHPLEVEAISTGVGNERMRRFLTSEAFNRTPPANLDPKSFHIPGTTVEQTIDQGDEVDLGGRRFRVIHTPGHTSGGISLFESETGILIAGDAIYEGPLFAHHPGGSVSDYQLALQRLAALVPDLSVVYPSHNRYPLEPAFILAVQEALERIVAGMSPDESENGLHRFNFDRFSFTVRSSWRSEEERSETS